MSGKICVGAVTSGRPLLLSLALVFATMLLGLAVRFGRVGISPMFAKYGGSVLWALMIYWIVSSLLPRARMVHAAALAGALATCIEFLKLYHSPALDAFRGTLAGVLLLGRFFSVQDIGAYWLAVGVGAVLDQKIRTSFLSRD